MSMKLVNSDGREIVRWFGLEINGLDWEKLYGLDKPEIDGLVGWLESGFV